MALYIPHSIFRLARLLYVRPETFGPYYVACLMQEVSAAQLSQFSKQKNIHNSDKNLQRQ